MWDKHFRGSTPEGQEIFSQLEEVTLDKGHLKKSQKEEKQRHWFFNMSPSENYILQNIQNLDSKKKEHHIM